MKTTDEVVTTYGIEVTEIVTDEERQSYAMGVRAAKSLDATTFPVDIRLFMEGLVDAVNGQPILE